MKKAVVILGSPRKNSNTHILAVEAQRGLADQGIDCEIFVLNDLKIRGCQACYYCKRNGTVECAVKDDMQLIYEAINEADGLIVATPIYFCDVSAQTKTWLDRMFPYIDMNVDSMMPKGKKASFIFTQNQPEPSLFSEHIGTFKGMVGFLGFEVKDSLLAYDVDKGYKPMVTEHPEFMSKAYELGSRLLA